MMSVTDALGLVTGPETVRLMVAVDTVEVEVTGGLHVEGSVWIKVEQIEILLTLLVLLTLLII